ncbi:MAG: hypothetical protein AAGA31_21440, partial [Bacteroidota bacterium]
MSKKPAAKPMQSTLNLEQLRQRFFLEESPFWWAYDANRRNATVSKFRDNDPVLTDEEKLMYSWMQLEELIQMYQTGHFKVVLKKNSGDNVSKSPTYHVKWGAAAGAGIGSSTAMVNAQKVSEVALMERMFQLQEQNHRDQMEMMKQLLTERHTRENLEDQIEGMNSAGPGISESLLHGGLDILKSMLRPVPAQVGTLETAGTVPPPNSAGGEIPPQPSSDGARPFSLDQAIADIGIIRNALPNRHVNDVIRAIAVFAHNSPAQADQYLGMLI